MPKVVFIRCKWWIEICYCSHISLNVTQQGKFHVEPTYIANQVQINAKMRAILIDWLIQVHLRFTLLQETLYLTVSIIDRYLQVRHCALTVIITMYILYTCAC